MNLFISLQTLCLLECYVDYFRIAEGSVVLHGSSNASGNIHQDIVDLVSAGGIVTGLSERIIEHERQVDLAVMGMAGQDQVVHLDRQYISYIGPVDYGHGEVFRLDVGKH